MLRDETPRPIQEPERRLPPQPEEQRSASRVHTIYRLAKVVRKEDIGLWRVRNISDAGMMLVANIGVEVGEPLSIFLSDSIVIRGRIAWCEGGCIGVSFDRAINSAAVLIYLTEEQRELAHRPSRLPLETPALAYCETGVHAVRISNVSQQGMGITHRAGLKPGMKTKIVLESGRECDAVVRWSRGCQAGLSLFAPIPCAELESMRRFK